MSLGRYRRAAAACVVLGVVGGMAAAPAYADSAPPGGSGAARWSPISIAAAGDCNFPAKDVQSTPWSLQRVLLDQLWASTEGHGSKGGGVTVAVIDTGVDNVNQQLTGKVDDGGSLLVDPQTKKPLDGGTGFTDGVGHGTKVAGIIAARHMDGVGFVGLAPEARILSIRQNDNQGHGDVGTLMDAIQKAIDSHVQVINISQDVRANTDGGAFPDQDKLKAKLEAAEAAGIVVVASSGNDGNEGPTYPAAFPTVLAVGASDRNNERAPFSQYGDDSVFKNFVAAPGVDMLSTVPRGGQCVDNGTSFSSPYVAGLAADLKSMHPKWTPAQVRARIEQSAQRTGKGSDKFIGWGVVDPVKAVQGPDDQASDPKPDTVAKETVKLVAQPAGVAETQADRDRRTGTFVLGAGGLVVAGLAGSSIVMRDFRRRRES